MLGPLTIMVAKIIDDYHEKLGAFMANEFVTSMSSGQKNPEFTYVRIPFMMAANGVYHGKKVHPQILWGKYWYLYPQAWLWILSKDWRENVIEVNLKRFNDIGELDRAINDLTMIFIRRSTNVPTTG